MLGRNRPQSTCWRTAAAWPAPGRLAGRLRHRGAEPGRALGEQQPGPLPGEHAGCRPAAHRVREQRGGQVVPRALRHDGVDPVVVGGGQQRQAAAVGGAGDTYPRVTRPVEQHPGLAGQPGDELAGVPDLVVRRVEPDLAAAGAGAARGPGEHGETGPGQVFGLRSDRVLGFTEPRCEQDRREPALAGRGEEARVEHHVLVAPRAVHHADPHGADGDTDRLAEHGRQRDRARQQRHHGHGHDQEPPPRAPPHVHGRDASNADGQSLAALSRLSAKMALIFTELAFVTARCTVVVQFC